MKKIISKLFVVLVIAASSALINHYRDFLPHKSDAESKTLEVNNLTDLKTIKRAFDNQQSNVQVKQKGRVIKLLRDDNSGSRHQKFVVELESGQKLLIAHNIELAPKINELQAGDDIAFSGEYEWNNKGGVIHWTHHDPRGSHLGGWLLHKNRKYE